MEGGPTAYDADVDKHVIPLLIGPDTDVEDSLDMNLYKKQDPLSSDHFALHLPQCQGFSGCDWGKTSKTRSRRRTQPKVTVAAPDAIAFPFGAMIHLYHIAMERNSEASRAARCSKSIREKPASVWSSLHTRDAEAVVDTTHQFDDGQPAVRRCWADAAP